MGGLATHFDTLLGDPDMEPSLRIADPDVESVRSHPSSHADQSLLPHPSPTAATAPVRSHTQRLQRRRHQQQYYLSPSNAQPLSSVLQGPHPSSSPQHPAEQRTPLPRPISSPQQQQHDTPQHKRVKSYSAGGANGPSWLLLGSNGAFSEAKRQSWTGERRETRKLQKDHPVGSARPGCGVEIGDGDDDDDEGGSNWLAGPVGEREGSRQGGSMLGVRRKMERLKGLYRNREKEVAVTSNVR